MGNLQELIQQYTIKRERAIKKICAPLESLGFPVFFYFRIEPDGRFGTVSNYPEEIDYYYSEQFYLDNPYLIHPSLIYSGYTCSTAAPYNTELSDKIFNRFQLFHVFVIFQKFAEAIEGFVFAPQKRSSSEMIQKIEFYSKLRQMHLFSHYFKREAHALIENMMMDNFNLKKEKGDAFFQANTAFPLLHTDANILKFEKAISPLSARERQCLDLFKQGYSAQSTAALLGLSQRTVEHYFENIKNKLGCQSKWELLDC